MCFAHWRWHAKRGWQKRVNWCALKLFSGFDVFKFNLRLALIWPTIRFSLSVVLNVPTTSHWAPNDIQTGALFSVEARPWTGWVWSVHASTMTGQYGSCWLLCFQPRRLKSPQRTSNSKLSPPCCYFKCFLDFVHNSEGSLLFREGRQHSSLSCDRQRYARFV